MLEDSLFESQGRRETRKPLTVFIATIIHVIVGIVLVLIPLFPTQAITIPMADMSLWAPQPESRRAVEVTTVPPAVRTRVAIDPNDVIAPTRMPSGIAPVVDEAAFPPVDLPLPTAGGGAGSILRDWIGRQALLKEPSPPEPAPPPPVPPEKARWIRVSTGPHAAELIHRVLPVYPAIAKITRTQGLVVLEALITKEGTIDSLRVISGPQLLIQAALDAVRQWRYRPTLLNGEPVEVITTITVNFTLQ